MWMLLGEGTAAQRKARGEGMFGVWLEQKMEKSLKGQKAEESGCHSQAWR